MDKAGMTLHGLAMALKGTPRDALIMIATPTGLVPVRSVRSAYGRSVDGVNTTLESASSVSQATAYLIVLDSDPV